MFSPSLLHLAILDILRILKTVLRLELLALPCLAHHAVKLLHLFQRKKLGLICETSHKHGANGENGKEMEIEITLKTDETIKY